MITANAGPVPDHLKDGEPVLIYARWGWESLDRLDPEPSWRVAAYDPDLAWDWEEVKRVPGWRSTSSNAYKDYAPVEAIAWAEIPTLPQERQS